MAIKLVSVIQIVMIYAMSKMIFVLKSMAGSVMSILFITVIKSVAMYMIKVVRFSLRIIVSFIVALRVACIAMMTVEALWTIIKS